MDFPLTSVEAQQVATAIARSLEEESMIVRSEAPAWDDAPYRTTLLARKGPFSILVEAQCDVNYGKGLADLARYLQARRQYAELYIATPAESVLPGTMLKQLRRDGVGLFLVEEGGDVTLQEKARNWALVVNPDPTLNYGSCRPEVQGAVKKYNEVDRKDGLRDLCDIFEREVENLAVLAARKRMLNAPENAVLAMNLSGQINCLASNRAYAGEWEPLVGEGLKIDLHSFRTARNLVDHPVHGRREDKKREMQFHDKMLQGTRLIAQLVSLQNKVRKSKAATGP